MERIERPLWNINEKCLSRVRPHDLEVIIAYLREAHGERAAKMIDPVKLQKNLKDCVFDVNKAIMKMMNNVD
jgi:hypothetical protein